MGLFDKLFKKKRVEPKEENFIIKVTDQFVEVKYPRKEAERVNWDDLVEIKLINTDQGPVLPDVWLALIGSDSSCLIPQGVEGYEEVYDIVSKYEGFDFKNVIKSMSSTGNEQFELWKK